MEVLTRSQDLLKVRVKYPKHRGAIALSILLFCTSIGAIVINLSVFSGDPFTTGFDYIFLGVVVAFTIGSMLLFSHLTGGRELLVATKDTIEITKQFFPYSKKLSFNIADIKKAEIIEKDVIKTGAHIEMSINDQSQYKEAGKGVVDINVNGFRVRMWTLVEKGGGTIKLFVDNQKSPIGFGLGMFHSDGLEILEALKEMGIEIELHEHPASVQ